LIQRVKKYAIFLIAISLAFSCSTKKNTALRRGYHNLTAHYNVLFNGNESFKKGMQKLETSHKDDYSEILPVFLYSKKEDLATIGSDMDRAIKKATKLITLHSITVKPDIDTKADLTPKEREFYSKKEYNKWVDDAYLLLGKSHFYKKEFGIAKESFNYIIATFGDIETAFEAKIWLTRIANEEERFRESEQNLNELIKITTLSKELLGEVYATWTDLELKQSNYNNAIPYLEKTIENTKHKSQRLRYNFLLAQLYAKIGDNVNASLYYNKVVGMNPPYEMAFNAKINQALTYQSGGVSRKDIEKELRKLLKDDKNIEYRDQIYYAIGQLYFKDQNFDEAVKYYKLSLAVGKDNNQQRARTQLTLADWYYAKPDYVNAQCYYDSAVSFIDEKYPDYKILQAKAASLTNLVKNMNMVNFEDSVLALSGKSQVDIEAVINARIEAERKAEEEQNQKKLEADQALQEMAENNQQSNTATAGSNGWYFYNPSAKISGHKEFIKYWGSRKLEDNWRRKSKTSVSFGETLTDATGEKKETKTDKAKITNKLSRDYYLQNIPFSDSAKMDANKKISTGLFNMGVIYGEELKDYKRAIQSFETLLSQFPNYENRLLVYFKLYTLAKNDNDMERTVKYQNKIISEFPNSSYAKIITNPNYLTELQAEEKKISDNYEQTYHLFNQGQYNLVETRAAQAIKDYPSSKLNPGYEYMLVVALGLKKDTLSFVTDLQNYAEKYPKTDLSENAQILIKYLQNKHPEIAEKQNEMVAHSLFSASMNEIHTFAYLVPPQTNLNQLIFNVINFNLDNFDSLKLEVKKVNVGKNNYCQVSQFKDGNEAMIYYKKIINNTDIFHDLEKSDLVSFVISQSNLKALTESGKNEQYMIFFRENYK
jgi:tetratricopeptide (TPR) repeat protein